MAYVIGIDHGNGNMKTENTIYPCGYKMQEIEPNKLFAQDIIEYKDKFYTLSSTKFPYQTDKTTDEKAFILTLFSIAKEIVARAASGKTDYNVQRDFTGFVGKDVILAVGLPPAHFEKQAGAFKQYLLKRAEHGINFKYNGKPFNFYVKDVLVFPQDYAAAVVFMESVLTEFSTCYCIDIGDGTTDMVGLEDGVPIKETMLSREIGMSKLRSKIIDDVINDYGITLSDRNVEDFLSGKKIALPPDEAEHIKKRMEETTKAFATEIVNQLHSKVPDFRITPVIFSGGGAKALKQYLIQTNAFSEPFMYFIDAINANAVGYQQIAKMQLGIE